MIAAPPNFTTKRQARHMGRFVVPHMIWLFLSPTHTLPNTPRHVHLAYTESAGIIITWSTVNATATSVVQYGLGSMLGHSAIGETDPLAVNDTQGRLSYHSFIHRATLQQLVPGVSYTYRVGDAAGGWSSTRSFAYKPASTRRAPLTILAVADMSADAVDGGHGGVARELAREVAQRDYDMVVHAGDLAYDLHGSLSDGSSIGDAFMNDIEAIAGRVPYMVSPGNHESFANFSHFKGRFSMPYRGISHNLWWSVDIGLVHFVSYNTEAYFDGPISVTMRAQYDWLMADLSAAAAPDRRAAVPWIIAMGHRPFYCNVMSKAGTCDGEQEQSRVGPPSQEGKYSVEALFQKFGVDLALFGHVHDYTRFRPTFNHVVDITSVSTDGHTYTNPRATTYLTIGGAGNPEMPQPPVSKCTVWDVGCTPVDWSPWAVCESGYFPKCPNFNYGRCIIHNATHLEWEQISVTRPGASLNGTILRNASIVPGHVIDSMLLVQTKHGPFRLVA